MAARTADKKKPTGTAPEKRRSGVARFFRGAVLALDALVVAALVFTAYSGNISPLKHGGAWGILPLCFPLCLWLTLFIFAVHLLWNRHGLIITGLGLLLCAGPILNYSPLHFTTSKVPADAESFTFLTYNVHQFLTPHTQYNSDTLSNTTLDYIINSGADIVCLQEATHLGAVRRGYLSKTQVEKLHAIYPHIHVDGTELAFLSKYPVEPIHLDTNNENMEGGIVACYRVSLPSGKIVNFFNVHLQSFLLDADDREIYLGLTRLKSEKFDDVKEHLLSKVSRAAVARARQVQQLLRYIRLYGGPDVIISGDFNDVPGCYSLRTLESAGFRSAYPDVGLGPLVTYNDQRLYFCIDHTLYRGALKPVSMKKGTLRSSDHYPLTTRFYIGK